MRAVEILSLCYRTGALEEEALFHLLEKNLQKKTDIVLLPEACMGDVLHAPEDHFLSRMSRLAAQHAVYLLCPVFLMRAGKRYNCALLFDRNGNTIYAYDKTYPYHAELKRTPPVCAGNGVRAADTDFGRMAAAICFDANFPELWSDIAAADVQIVFWVSAYSAGQQLAAHALNHHYVIVTATQYPDCAVFDPDGKEVFYAYNEGKPLAARVRVDLDRVICHYNFNRDKIERLIAEHPEVEIERERNREQWILLHAPQSPNCVRELCAQYGIMELRHYKEESRRLINPLYLARRKEYGHEE